MPCYDHRERDDCIECAEERDELAEWLCLILTPMPETLIAALPLGLQKWWNDHREFDRQRKTPSA